MDLTELHKIGLTEGEIKVYTALLDLGECTKTALAQKSGVAPSNIYDITNRLLEKGIISKVEKNGIAHFSAANPKHILNYLEHKGEELEKEKEVVSALLPLLIDKYTQKESGTRVEVFMGWNGLKTIFDDMLAECKKGDENYVFGASKGTNESQTDLFFEKYSPIRAKKGIKTYLVMNEELRTGKERIAAMLASPMYSIKFLKQSTPAEIMIYRNKACIIILTENPLVIRITSQEVASSFIQYFRILWKTAKP